MHGIISPHRTPAHAPVLPTPGPYTFADEFSGVHGLPPDPSRWQHVTGAGSVVGGNRETETYTASTQNAHLDGNGHLVISVTEGLHSARLTSKFTQLYGSWEASLAIEDTPGCWPAFWFLGKEGGFPACGEIDLMENYGTGFTDGTIWDGTDSNSVCQVSARPADSGFHVYRMSCQPSGVQLFRDNVMFAEATPGELQPWAFDTNGGLYALLNIATDGSGTGGVSPDPAKLPVSMIVDYVHAWK